MDTQSTRGRVRIAISTSTRVPIAARQRTASAILLAAQCAALATAPAITAGTEMTTAILHPSRHIDAMLLEIEQALSDTEFPMDESVRVGNYEPLCNVGRKGYERGIKV